MSRFEIGRDFQEISFTLKAADFENKKLFNIFDLNSNGQLDENEATSILSKFNKYKNRIFSTNKIKTNDGNSIFDEKESKNFIEELETDTGKKFATFDITIIDIFEFCETIAEKVLIRDNGCKEKSESDIPEKTPQPLNVSQAKIAQELANIPERENEQFSEEECALLAQLTPEELNEAKKFFYMESRDKQLSAEDIIFLIKGYKEKFNISPECYERIPEFLALKDKNGNQLNIHSIMLLLSGKTEDKIDKGITLLKTANSGFDNAEIIANFNFALSAQSSYLYDFMLENPEIKFSHDKHHTYRFKDSLETTLDGITYRFSLYQKKPEEITYEQVGEDIVQTIYNPNLEQKQIITYPSTKLDDNFILPEPSRVETRHLDESGNIVSTEICENSEIPGTRNIYTIDKNGTRVDVQTAIVDTESGIQTITKNFASNEGVITKSKLVTNPQTNEYELDYEISNPNGENPEIIYSKHQSLKQLDENNYVYTKDNKIYNLTIIRENSNESGILRITDNSQNKTYEIDLNKLFPDEQDKIMADRFIKFPAEMLVFLSEHPLDNINYGKYQKENNGHYNYDNNTIEIGIAHVSKTELKDTLYSVLCHEFGHYFDRNIGDVINSISTNEEFIKCHREELESFRKNNTTFEQEYAGYFTGSTTPEGAIRGQSETVAESNMLLNTTPKARTATRAYLLQRYFPRTIALATKMIQEKL